ncbi:MAG: hypothetical protein D8M59_01995 [Planctomycetes bacterium]|nr:hypothetical protein [Planctomycetota bacterium]NOG54507.1 hypothetical protein [Planctomycetota bacterium]
MYRTSSVWWIVCAVSLVVLGKHALAGTRPVPARILSASGALVTAGFQHDEQQTNHEAVPEQDPGHEQSEPGHDEESEAHATDSAGHSGAEGEHGGAEAARADALAVHEAPAWYGPVVIGAAVLFLLAIVLGSAAVVMKGPEPADPPHAHGHDDHH